MKSAQQNIPKHHFELIDKTLQKTFSESDWVLQNVFTRGLSGAALYQIKIGNEVVVARIDDPTNHPHNNLAREYHAMQIAGEEKIAPQLYYADPEKGIAILQFIQTLPISLNEFTEPRHSKKLAKLVHKLHQGSAFQPDRTIFERLNVIHKLIPIELQQSELLIRSMEEKEKLKNWLSDVSDIKPCHCDINPFNVLFDGEQFWLIDWNAASQQNFYFDLACVVNFFYFNNDHAANQFLMHYFVKEPSLPELSKFYLMRIFSGFYFGTFFLYLSGQKQTLALSNKDIDLLPDYPTFIEQIKKGEERFDNALSQQKFGFVLLKMALAKLSDTRFDNATLILNNAKAH